ncbi:MAG: Cobalt/magnesium transport protein CorA [Chlamydiia bacterium]|nr:Cobalt/magnesium transport protein CorA [Chlamydiia bacterium]
MINVYYKDEGEGHFNKIDDYRTNSWINCNHATSADIEELAGLAELDYSNLEDALDKHELPRIEKIGESVVIFCRLPSSRSELGTFTSTITFVLTKKYLITITTHASSIIEMFLETANTLGTAQRVKCLLSLLHKISHTFSGNIRRARTEVLIQEKEMQLVTAEDITDISKREERLNQFLSAMAPLKSVLECLTTGRFIALAENEHDELEDLIHSYTQIEDMCRTNLRMTSNQRNLYQIIFTNNLNKTMKLLTAMTILLSLPTMIASLYGMNVALPIEKNPIAFYYIIGFILVLSFAAFYIFQKKKWL